MKVIDFIPKDLIFQPAGLNSSVVVWSLPRICGQTCLDHIPGLLVSWLPTLRNGFKLSNLISLICRRDIVMSSFEDMS